MLYRTTSGWVFVSTKADNFKEISGPFPFVLVAKRKAFVKGNNGTNSTCVCGNKIMYS